MIIWVQYVLPKIKYIMAKVSTLMYDNISLEVRTKKRIKVKKIDTADNPVDMLPKLVP